MINLPTIIHGQRHILTQTLSLILAQALDKPVDIRLCDSQFTESDRQPYRREECLQTSNALESHRLQVV